MNIKNSDLEALRAIAIMLTLVEHRGELLFWVGEEVPLFNWMNFRPGVDIFFVISGYVIASGLSDIIGRSEGFRQAGAFWIKRAFRLLPTAVLWAVIAVLLAAFANEWERYGTLDANLDGLAAALSNTMNFYYYLQSEAKEWIGPLRVYWSLSLEEQFYAVLPLLFILFRSHKILIVLSLTIVLVQFCVPDRNFPSLAWFIRTDALFLGVVMALLRGTAVPVLFEPKFLGKSEVHRLLFMILLVIGMTVVDGGHLTTLFQANLITVLAFVLVWCAHFDKSYILGDGAVKRALVWLGSRSYSVYVIHDVVFLAVADIWIGMPMRISWFELKLWLSVPVALIVILGLAEVNYRFIERPLRDRGRRIATAYLQRQATTAA